MSDREIDLDEVRAFLAEKESRRRKGLDDRFRQAAEDAERIISEISAQFDVERIWQFGSLLDRSHFSEISDIDIAIEGVRGPQEFFGIIGTAERLTGFPVDVVEIERVRPEVADRIRRKGRLAYERKTP